MTTKRGRSTYRPSSKPRPWFERLGSRRGVLIVIGLTLFLVVDAILIGLALTANAPGDGPATQRPLATFGATAAADPAPAEPAPVAEATGRFLTAGSSTVLWRATAGTCEVPAVVERSADAGASWSALPTGPAVDLRIVLAMTATSADELQLVGAAGADCATGGFASSEAGARWQPEPELLATIAYQAPAPTGGVSAAVVGGQPVPAPCPTIDVLAASSDRTVAACSAVLAEWSADAASWTTVPFAGIHAADVQSGRILFAARGIPGCAGLGMLRVSGDALTLTSGTENIACIADADVSAPAALASADDAAWLWIGDSVLRSTDGGVSWSPAGA